MVAHVGFASGKADLLILASITSSGRSLGADVVVSLYCTWPDGLHKGPSCCGVMWSEIVAQRICVCERMHGRARCTCMLSSCAVRLHAPSLWMIGSLSIDACTTDSVSLVRMSGFAAGLGSAKHMCAGTND